MSSNNTDPVAALLADAQGVLSRTLLEDVRERTKTGRQTIVQAHLGYDELVRRGGGVAMTCEQRAAFQNLLDRLRASLRFLGESM